MKIQHLFAGLLALLCLTSYASQNAITQPAVSHIRAGITTEADLRQHFGAPDTRLTTNRGELSLGWFRSLSPKPGGYVPVFGQFLGGLDFEVQQLSVVIVASGRVRSYTFYDSNGAVKTERTRSATTGAVDFRKLPAAALARRVEDRERRGLARRGFRQELLEHGVTDRFLQHRERARPLRREIAIFTQPGEEKNPARGVFTEDVPAGGEAVEPAHFEIHQHHLGLVPAIGADRVETCVHDVHHLVAAMANHLGERPGEFSFVVGNQHAHTHFEEDLMPPAAEFFGFGVDILRGILQA